MVGGRDVAWPSAGGVSDHFLSVVIRGRSKQKGQPHGWPFCVEGAPEPGAGACSAHVTRIMTPAAADNG